MPVGAGFIPARIGENKKMTEHKKLQPEIRFAGFTDDWEQRKLGEVVEFFSGLTYSPTDVLNNGTLVLRSSNIQDSQIVTDDNVYVRPECVYSQNVEIGDIVVVVRNGSKNLIGKHALVSKQMNNTVIGAFMTGIRSNNPSFFNALLDTSKFNDEIEKNLGATINQITTGAFKSMEFLIPSYEEQTQIGNFFKQLDDTIALHQRELEKFKILKTSYLEHIFLGKVSLFTAKNTITWEQRKLGDLAHTFIGGGTPATNNIEFWDGSIPWLQSSDLIEDIVFNIIPRKFISKKALKKSATKLIPSNSITIVTRVGVGKLALIPYEFATSQDFISFSELKLDLIFASYAFYRLMKEESKSTQGTSIKGITKEVILNKYIYVPKSKEEQTQIGNFFKQLDDTIALHQKELAKYQQIKAACLEKMFVE